MKNIKEYLKSEDTFITLYHKNGKEALWYWEGKDGSWIESTYDKNGRTLTYKDSNGQWRKYTRDEDGNELTFEDST